MIMENVNIDKNIIGYVYVIQKEENMIKDTDSYQYKCEDRITPIDVIEVKYSDYEKYYEVRND